MAGRDLFVAAVEERWDDVKKLLKQGADPNWQFNEKKPKDWKKWKGCTVFHVHTLKGSDMKRLSLLLDAGASNDVRDAKKRTPVEAGRFRGKHFPAYNAIIDKLEAELAKPPKKKKSKKKQSSSESESESESASASEPSEESSEEVKKKKRSKSRKSSAAKADAIPPPSGDNPGYAAQPPQYGHETMSRGAPPPQYGHETMSRGAPPPQYGHETMVRGAPYGGVPAPSSGPLGDPYGGVTGGGGVIPASRRAMMGDISAAGLGLPDGTDDALLELLSMVELHREELSTAVRRLHEAQRKQIDELEDRIERLSEENRLLQERINIRDQPTNRQRRRSRAMSIGGANSPRDYMQRTGGEVSYGGGSFSSSGSQTTLRRDRIGRY